jgi:hypothetical protein
MPRHESTFSDFLLITPLLGAEGDCMILDRLKILLAILNVQAEAGPIQEPAAWIARFSIELQYCSALVAAWATRRQPECNT